MAEKKINANIQSNAILGTFDGECADANITNANGLDITRAVWEGVFASEEYKKYIKLGHYIGFLGHPEDPGCQDFEHACVVMTEGSIDSNGKVHGKFNLIDTPVGRIVKSFIDAGVKFGISVRGAGDIINNSVDPDTFVFRGFDLVAFPAYPNAIPDFKEIAASSDVEQQAKYKAVCAAVKSNLKGLNTCASTELAQSYFAPQSELYNILEDHKQCLLNGDECDEEINTNTCEGDECEPTQVDGLMNLYLEEKKRADALAEECRALRHDNIEIAASHRRHIKSIERITASQLTDMDEALATQASKVTKAVMASKQLQTRVSRLEGLNLKYKQKIQASEAELEKNRSIMANMQISLDETVRRAEDAEAAKSNCDGTIKQLRADIKASEELYTSKVNELAESNDDADERIAAANERAAQAESQLSKCQDAITGLKEDIKAAQRIIDEYQNAYAQMYANAVGVNLDNVSVTASTSVKELQDLIWSSSKASGTYITEPTPVVDVIDLADGSDLITL